MANGDFKGRRYKLISYCLRRVEYNNMLQKGRKKSVLVIGDCGLPTHPSSSWLSSSKSKHNDKNDKPERQSSHSYTKRYK